MTFGENLRYYRRQAVDPVRGGALTQARFAELLEERVGRRYSAAALSLWERDKAAIDKDDRQLLTGLLKVLVECQALCESDADALLWSGHYRGLDAEERAFVAGIHVTTTLPFTTQRVQIVGLARLAITFLGPESPERAPSPTSSSQLADRLARVAGRLARGVQMHHLTFALFWLLLMWGMERYALALLAWPYDATVPYHVYALGALAIPAGSALVTWRQQAPDWPAATRSQRIARLALAYVGATIGFQVTFFGLFVLALLLHYLGLGTFASAPRLLRLLLAAIPLLVSYVGGHRLPALSHATAGQFQLAPADTGLWLTTTLASVAMAWGLVQFSPLLFHPVGGPFISLLSVALLSLLRASSRLVVGRALESESGQRLP